MAATFEMTVIDDHLLGQLIEKRDPKANKYTYGHALLVCGKRGMAGAAVLAAGGALRSGCGLVTVHLPAEERFALNANFPSAITSLDPNDCFSVVPDNIERYSAVGVGCGMGKAEPTRKAFTTLLSECKRLSIKTVIDADGLNLIAENEALFDSVPHNAILTPHTGELKRLVGEWGSEGEMLKKAERLAIEREVIVVVKGAETKIFTPRGDCYVNTTGNAGMAKGGSGDLLTGLTAGLLARGYSAVDAAVVGVYIHGSAGDKAAAYYGEEAMNSSDMIDFVAEAFTDFVDTTV